MVVESCKLLDLVSVSSFASGFNRFILVVSSVVYSNGILRASCEGN